MILPHSFIKTQKNKIRTFWDQRIRTCNISKISGREEYDPVISSCSVNYGTDDMSTKIRHYKFIKHKNQGTDGMSANDITSSFHQKYKNKARIINPNPNCMELKK